MRQGVVMGTSSPSEPRLLPVETGSLSGVERALRALYVRPRAPARDREQAQAIVAQCTAAPRTGFDARLIGGLALGLVAGAALAFATVLALELDLVADRAGLGLIIAGPAMAALLMPGRVWRWLHRHAGYERGERLCLRIVAASALAIAIWLVAGA